MPYRPIEEAQGEPFDKAGLAKELYSLKVYIEDYIGEYYRGYQGRY